MAGRCPHCAHVLAACENKRLPPWCPRCGGDLRKSEREQSPLDEAHPPLIALELPPLTWREPTSTASSLDPRPDRLAEDESLADSIQRVRTSQQAKNQQRWTNRKAGLGAFLGGLGFLALGIVLIWFQTTWGDTGRVVVPVGILAVALMITLAGLYSLLTGEQTFELNGELAWDIAIGSEGISRLPAGPGLIDGKIYYWLGIARLEYAEDLAFGTGRVLVVHMIDGNRERIRIAAEVTEKQLAEAVAAWGQRLEAAAAGDWHSRNLQRSC